MKNSNFLGNQKTLKMVKKLNKIDIRQEILSAGELWDNADK